MSYETIEHLTLRSLTPGDARALTHRWHGLGPQLDGAGGSWWGRDTESPIPTLGSVHRGVTPVTSSRVAPGSRTPLTRFAGVGLAGRPERHRSQVAPSPEKELDHAPGVHAALQPVAVRAADVHWRKVDELNARDIARHRVSNPGDHLLVGTFH